MNKRTLAIIAAFAVPVIAIASVAYLGSKDRAPRVAQPAPNATANPRPTLSLEQIRSRVRARVEELNAMTSAQWEEQKKKNPRITITLEQLRENAKKSLARLEAMTQEQWEAQQQEARQRMAQRPMAAAPTATVAPPKPLVTPKPAANAPKLQTDPYYPPAADTKK